MSCSQLLKQPCSAASLFLPLLIVLIAFCFVIKHLKPSKTKTGAPSEDARKCMFKIYFFVDSSTGRMAVPMQALGIWMLSRAHTVAAMSTILVG